MRVTYDKEMRERSKKENTGLVTIDILDAKGFRTTTQIYADVKQVRYAYRALTHILDMRKKTEGRRRSEIK